MKTFRVLAAWHGRPVCIGKVDAVSKGQALRIAVQRFGDCVELRVAA